MEATPPTVRLAVGLHRLSNALGRSVWSVQLTPPPSSPALAGIEADKRVCAAVTLETPSPQGVADELVSLRVLVSAPGVKALATAVETLLAGLELARARAAAAPVPAAPLPVPAAAPAPVAVTAEPPPEPEAVQRARRSVPTPVAPRAPAAATVPAPPPPAPGELYPALPADPVDPGDDGAPF